MKNLIVREYQNYSVRQYKCNGFINIIDLMKITKKDFAVWCKLKNIEKLFEIESLSFSVFYDEESIYADPKVALAFTIWCDPELYLSVFRWTIEYYKNS